MEAAIMTHNYNLSLIFYPQKRGGYTVVCPELPFCVSEGETLDEATANIYDVIADLLPDEVGKSETDEELLRIGLCMKGKLFQEVEVAIDETGEVVFPIAFAHAVGEES
jgi:predicted RNase H-like HicB family nuclease